MSLTIFEINPAHMEPNSNQKTKIHLPKKSSTNASNLQSLIERPLDEDFVQWEEDYFYFSSLFGWRIATAII